jgi:hypothetical protein
MSGILDLMTLINNATEGMFGIAILLIIWVVIYTRKRNITPTKEAIAGASWVIMLLAIPLRYLTLINDLILIICIVMGLGSIIILINRE